MYTMPRYPAIKEETAHLWGFSQGYVDSIKIIGRMMASAVVCRAVLMFELAGMRNAMFEAVGQQPASEDVSQFAAVPKNA